MAIDHPFQTLFETLGRPPTAHAESVNRRAFEVLMDLLVVPVEKTGRCILLRAPRAGHGKTHLLSRIQHFLGSSHEFIPLHPAFGCRIDTGSVTDDALRRLVRPLPASGGLCVLDLVTRRLFAAALQPLVGSGEVPCQDREGALSALRTRPIETFDFHHPNAVTAHWARENFEVLGQRLSLELAQRCGLPVREVAFWVDALFRFSATPVENPNRVRVLAESAHLDSRDEGIAMERLEALLGLVSLLMRVVLVADDLEGLSADESGALRLAAFLGSLRQSVERLDVVLSVNQDIWQSAFVPRLSGGLADRLSEVVIELNPLTPAEMAALLDSRVPGLGGRVLERIDLNEAGTHARGLIRAAGVAWLRATAQDAAQPPPTPPVAAVAAAVAVAPGLVMATEPPMEAHQVASEPEPREVAPDPEPREVEKPGEPETLAPAVGQPPLSSISESEVAASSEDPARWPAPEFPPFAAAPEPEEVAASEAPFESTEPTPRQDAETQEFSSVTVPELSDSAAAFHPEQAVASFDEPPQPIVGSPFQMADESSSPPAFTPSSGSAPFQTGGAFDPPPAQPPFQPAEDVNAPTPDASFHPVDGFNAPSAEPQFQSAGIFHPPSGENPFQPAADFNSTPGGSSFLPNPADFAHEPASPVFAPSNWQEPPVFNAPEASPLQVADPGYGQNPPPAAQSQNFVPQSSSYENPQTTVFQPEQPPEPQAWVEPAETAEPVMPPSASDTDRVDELLRQFRERYGRGGL